MSKLKALLRKYKPTTWDEWAMTVVLNLVPVPGAHPVGYVAYVAWKRAPKKKETVKRQFLLERIGNGVF